MKIGPRDLLIHMDEFQISSRLMLIAKTELGVPHDTFLELARVYSFKNRNMKKNPNHKVLGHHISAFQSSGENIGPAKYGKHENI